MIRINKDDKILVIAPHPDDESIGMGGFLSLYGDKTDVLLLTDGRHGHKKSSIDEENLVQNRLEEFTAACNIAKINSIIHLDIEDKKVFQNRKRVYRFKLSPYTYIFIPNRYENHIDHMAVYPIIRHMANIQHFAGKIVEYEVWTPLRYPTDYIDISNVIESKKHMISEHVSQLIDCDFVAKGIALSCYRGMFCGVKYAEAFCECKLSIKKWIVRNTPTYVRLFLREISLKK